MIILSFQEYLPVRDLLKIIAVCVAVAMIAPSAAALVITGFEAQAKAHEATQGRMAATCASRSALPLSRR